MAITYRQLKGSPLTNKELDDNFEEIETLMYNNNNYQYIDIYYVSYNNGSSYFNEKGNIKKPFDSIGSVFSIIEIPVSKKILIHVLDGYIYDNIPLYNNIDYYFEHGTVITKYAGFINQTSDDITCNISGYLRSQSDRLVEISTTNCNINMEILYHEIDDTSDMTFLYLSCYGSQINKFNFKSKYIDISTNITENIVFDGSFDVNFEIEEYFLLTNGFFLSGNNLNLNLNCKNININSEVNEFKSLFSINTSNNNIIVNANITSETDVINNVNNSIFAISNGICNLELHGEITTNNPIIHTNVTDNIINVRINDSLITSLSSNETLFDAYNDSLSLNIANSHILCSASTTSLCKITNYGTYNTLMNIKNCKISMQNINSHLLEISDLAYLGNNPLIIDKSVIVLPNTYNDTLILIDDALTYSIMSYDSYINVDYIPGLQSNITLYGNLNYDDDIYI